MIQVQQDYDPKISIYKREVKGVTIYYLRYYLPGSIRFRISVGKNKRVAEARLVAKRNSLIRGEFSDDELKKIQPLEKQTLPLSLSPQDCLKLYFENKSINKTKNTLEGQFYRLKKTFSLIVEQNGYQDVNQISLKDLESLYAWYINKAKTKTGAKIKAVSVNEYFKDFKTFFNYLYRHKILKENPFQFFETKRLLKSEACRDVFVPLHHLSKILEHANLELKDVVLFAVNTGLRKEELLYLEWSDINFEQGFLVIKNKPDLNWFPKWKKERIVVLNLQARGILKKRYKFSNFVFPTFCRATRTYVRRADIKRSWETALKKAGLFNYVEVNGQTRYGTRYRFHDLRRTLNVYGIESGLSPSVMSRLIGHSEVVNQNHYSNIILLEAQKKMELLPFSDTLTDTPE